MGMCEVGREGFVGPKRIHNILITYVSIDRLRVNAQRSVCEVLRLGLLRIWGTCKIIKDLQLFGDVHGGKFHIHGS